MSQEIYLISDAAKQVQVESHVLRYWEEELKLPIRRNEQGHRYYTKEDIEQLKQIKEWKEKGLQLKAIKMVIKGSPQKDMEILSLQTEADSPKIQPSEIQPPEAVGQGDSSLPAQAEISSEKEGQLAAESRAEKGMRLQMLLRQMISQAVRENNAQLSESVKEAVVKELDYQFRMQEEAASERERKRMEREEEHFRKLDELLGQKRKRKKHSIF